ncbi:MAG: type II toxin-antitoxin system RelE/ParE family toxin [Desulfitobacterium hafniense]|nr:type II toxin-antitoxin system RelE/ParE family toxin [Desulfitobacterium hafniense]
MAYKLIVSKEVHIDIDGIVNYIAVELGNPSAAASFLDDVDRSYRAVMDNPRMYGLTCCIICSMTSQTLR